MMQAAEGSLAPIFLYGILGLKLSSSKYVLGRDGRREFSQFRSFPNLEFSQ